MFKDSFLYLFFSAAIISLYILKSIGLFFYSEISITYAPSLRSNLSLDLLLTISLRMLISLIKVVLIHAQAGSDIAKEVLNVLVVANENEFLTFVITALNTKFYSKYLIF